MTSDNLISRYRMFLWGILLMLAAGCSDETYTEETFPHPPAMLTLSMQVSVPGHERPTIAARQMSPESENRLESVHVLVFREDPTGEERYVYTAGVVEKSTGQTTTVLKVNLRQSDATERYRLVLLANMPDFAPPATDTPKEEALSRYILSIPDKWNTAEGGTPIPMWGETELMPLDKNSVPKDYHTGSAPIRLLRALCRVDVGLFFDGDPGSESTKGLPGFRLGSIAVYHSSSRARAVPSADHLKEGVAVLPTLPEGNEHLRPENSPLLYKVEGGDGYIREIYLPEAPAGTSNGDAVCLVVGGYYGAENTDRETFYRVDFLAPADAGGKQAYLPLLRNHRYKVNITRVSGAGFDSREDALKSTPVNLETSVTVWNETSVSEVQYDGRYMLGVDRTHLSFYQNASAQNLTVHTDYPDGWKAVVSEGGGWLSCSPGSGAANREAQLTCAVVRNNTGGERQGIITVSAGRMKWNVRVTQLPYLGLSLTLTDASGKEITDMEFPDRDIKPQELQVKWSPATAIVEVWRSGDAFAGEPVADIHGNGTAVFTLKPDPLNVDEGNPFPSRSEIINFVLKGEDGSTIARTLVLEQKRYDVFAETESGVSLMDNSGMYLMDGQAASFRVRGNTPYRLRMIENEVDTSAGGAPGTVISHDIDQYYGGKIIGEMVSFTPHDDLTHPTRFLGHATFEITSAGTPAKFAPKRFRIRLASGIPQPEANSYMMKPGDKAGILIPVSRANAFADWTRTARPLGKDTPFEAHMVWNDKPEVSNFSNIRLLKSAGRGEKGYILVLPGMAEGNAVVAATTPSGEVLWSWHLWVSRYVPTKGQKWMDRNLGAMGNSEADGTRAYGLLYQWGRKDPFPPLPNSIVYDGDNGERKDFLSTYKQKERMTLRESVRHPERLVGNERNWLAKEEETAYWSNLWGGTIVKQGNAPATVKSLFDPSPPGWKIPAYGEEAWGTNDLARNWSKNPNGDMLNGHGGWYPITGFLYNGNRYGNNDEGYCWTSSVRPTLVAPYYLVIRRGNHLVNNTAYQRASGMAIRCVRE